MDENRRAEVKENIRKRRDNEVKIKSESMCLLERREGQLKMMRLRVTDCLSSYQPINK